MVAGISNLPPKPGTSRWTDCLDRHFMTFITAFLLLVYMVTYLAAPHGVPIRDDGAGYYAYLPSLILYGDPSFERDAEARYGGEFPRWTYVRRYPPTGRYLDSYNIGVSLLMLPFFLAGHALTYWFGWPWEGGPAWMQMRFPPDGYSLFYQHSAGLAGMFYFLVGFALLKQMLRRFFSKGVVLATLISLLLGTNLLNYAATETVISHPYTFFLASALLALTMAWYNRPTSKRLAMGLGAVVALLYLVRPFNAPYIIWIPLFGLVSSREVRERFRFLFRQWNALLWMGLSAFVVMIPQFLLWKYATGHYLVWAYQHMSRSALGRPDILGVLFGVQKGLFTWFPLFVLVAFGLPFMKGGVQAFRTPGLVVFGSYVLIISINVFWMSAGGFGNRYVADTVILAAFPLAAFFGALTKRWMRWAVGVAVMLCIFQALFLLTLLYRREMTYYGLDAAGFYDVYWWRWKELLQWWRGG